jgi:hypothetical protein
MSGNSKQPAAERAHSLGSFTNIWNSSDQTRTRQYLPCQHKAAELLARINIGVLLLLPPSQLLLLHAEVLCQI